MSKNTLPAFITTTENDYDKAMAAQATLAEKDPVGYAVQELLHAWKVNRFNMSYGYSESLQFFMKDAHWNEIKEKILEKGLPVDLNEVETLKNAFYNNLKKRR
jgi:hypothetical protein